MALNVSVYIGRFSPFHKGHAYVLERAMLKSNLVIVLIGSAGQARSIKNPFTANERMAMISEWVRDIKQKFPLLEACEVRIVPIRDYPYNNTLWIRQVQQVVGSTISLFSGGAAVNTNIKLTGSDRDSSTWYLSAFKQWELDLVAPYRQGQIMNVAATDIRRWLWDGSVPDGELDYIPSTLPDSTRNFLMRFISTPEHEALKAEFRFITRYKQTWSVAPYPVTFTTVDAVVVQSGHVLVIQRGHQPGKGLWALPGGFLDQHETLSEGAIRELVEETGLRLAQGKNAREITKSILRGSIRDKEVFDAPDRSARGRTITTAFYIRLDDTKPLPVVHAGSDEADAPDEILDAKWITVDEALARTDMWFEDHHAIIETLIASKEL